MFKEKFKTVVTFVIILFVLRCKFVINEEISTCDFIDGEDACEPKYCDDLLTIYTPKNDHEFYARVNFRQKSNKVDFNNSWEIQLLFSQDLSQLLVYDLYIYEETMLNKITKYYLGRTKINNIERIDDKTFLLKGNFNDINVNDTTDTISIGIRFHAIYPKSKGFTELIKLIYNGRTICQDTYQCGLTSGTIETIAYGDNAEAGEFPWVAATFYNTLPIKKYICGGSLISDQLVLTAAHCTVKPNLTASDLLVSLGKHELFRINENSNQNFYVDEIMIHPDYGKMVNGIQDADIAVYKLHSKAVLNNYVRPVCLHFRVGEYPPSGTNGTIVGWGMDQTGEVTGGLLKKLSVPIVPLDQCKASEIRFSNLGERTFCAGNRDGKGPCLGDSGGGFVSKFKLAGDNRIRYHIDGIISKSLKNSNKNDYFKCDLSHYTIYTDVFSFRYWLLNNTGALINWQNRYTSTSFNFLFNLKNSNV